MGAFGYLTVRAVSRHETGIASLLRKWRGFLIGNADLHGLVRCPPLSRRWAASAKWVADLGCGCGYFHTESLLRTGFAGRVLAAERDFEALRSAREVSRACGLESRIFHVCCSVDALPFSNETFDQIFLVDVIEHVQDDNRVLSEAGRTLREGGKVEISTPTPLYPKVFGRAFHERIGHVRDGYALDELTERLKAASFRVSHEGQNTGLLLWPWMRLAYRSQAAARGLLRRIFSNLLLVVLGVLTRMSSTVDVLGGYCSNAVEAQKVGWPRSNDL